MRVILLLFFYIFAFSNEIYNKKEQQYLKNHPVIFITAMKYWPIDKNGESIHTNFIKLINKYGHLNIKPIYYSYWSDAYNDAKIGKIPLIMGFSRSKTREKYFFYTKPYNFTPYYLLVRKNSNINSLKDLKNKKVFISKNSILREIFKNKNFKIVYVKHAYQKLQEGQIDAIALFYLPKKEYLKKFKIIKTFIDNYGKEYIGVNKNYPILYSILNKAIAQIPYKEIEKIRNLTYQRPIPTHQTINEPDLSINDLLTTKDILFICLTVGIFITILFVIFSNTLKNLSIKNFLLTFFFVQGFILLFLFYEIVSIHSYSRQIINLKTKNFNSLFLIDTIEHTIIKLNQEFMHYKSINKIKKHFLSHKIKTENLLINDKPLQFYLNQKYFSPKELKMLSKILLEVDKILIIQKEYLAKKVSLSLLNKEVLCVSNKLYHLKKLIYSENKKQIKLLKEKIKFQYILLIIGFFLFTIENIFVFFIFKEKIYSPIDYLINTIKKLKTSQNPQKKVFYNDEFKILIKEFFTLQNQLNKKIKELNNHKQNLEERIKKEVSKRLHQEEILQKQSKLATMGELMDIVAHQWKNPLNTIKLLIEVYKYNNQNIDKELNQTLNDIESQVNHLKTTLEEFRKFFHNKEKQQFCIQRLLHNTLLLLKDDLNANSINVNLNLPVNFCLEGYENEFQHLIITIISNAKEIFKERDIKKREITISTEEDDEFYYLIIEDNAGGIKKEYLNKIFEYNFTTKKDGTGIGLYLANQIAIKHSGSLEAKNSDKGAMFIFKIKKDKTI